MAGRCSGRGGAGSTENDDNDEGQATNLSGETTRMMKAIILAGAILAVASCSTAPQQEQTGLVHVTSQTIASQPAGSPYVIDLTHSGTAYDVAPGIDHNRVRVRTRFRDEMTMDKFVSSRGGKFASQRLLLGSLDDLIALVPFPDEVISGLKCDKNSGSCWCSGRKDCSDLSRYGACISGPGDAECGQGSAGGSRWACTCQMRNRPPEMEAR